MSHGTNGPLFTLTATEALGLYLRVAADGSLAGAADLDVGTVENPAFAAGDPVTVRSRRNPGPVIGVALNAISAGAEVFAGANGTVSATGTVGIGHAITASGAAGEPVSFVRGETTVP
jgi:hypothetical protein